MPVDNMSWSPPELTPASGKKRQKERQKVESVNGHCALPEKVKHEHLDDIEMAMKVR